MHLQEDAWVEHTSSEGPYRRVDLDAPNLAERLSPGQFVSADLGDVVRTPLLPARIEQNTVVLLLPLDHPVASLHDGTVVNLLGPLGQALDLPTAPTRLLLIADAPHLPVLLPTAMHCLAQGSAVTLLLSADTAADLYPPALLPPALEIHLVTADGSTGRAGSPLYLLPDLLPWADRVLVATDPTLYHPIATTVEAVRLMPAADFAQGYLLPTIVCGVGACTACAVRTRHATRHACTDGPFFNLLELEIQ